MSYYQEKIAKNTFFSFVNRLLVLASGIVSSIIVARTLGPERMGVYSFVITLVTLIVTVISIGLPGTLNKYLAEFSGSKETAKQNGAFNFALRIELWLGSLVALGYFLVSYVIIGGQPDMWLLYVLGGLAIMPMLLLGIVNAALVGLQDFKYLALSSLLIAISTLSLYVLAWFWHGGISGFLAAIVIANLFTFIIILLKVKKQLKVNIVVIINQALKDKLIAYAFPVAIITILDTVIWQRSEVIFLGIFRPSQEVAFYSTTFNIANTAIGSLPGAFGAILLPEFSRFFGARDFTSIDRLFKQAIRYLLIITIPLAMALSFLAKPLILLLYGQAYLPGAQILPLLVVPAAVGVIAGTAAQILYTREKQKTIMKYSIIVMAINIGLDFWLIPSGGLWGAAIANAAGQITSGLIAIILVYYIFKNQLPYGQIMRIILAALLMVPLLWFLPEIIGLWSGFWLAIGGGLVVFIEGLILFKVISHDDVQRFANLKARMPKGLQFLYSGFLKLIACQLKE